MTEDDLTGLVKAAMIDVVTGLKPTVDRILTAYELSVGARALDAISTSSTFHHRVAAALAARYECVAGYDGHDVCVPGSRCIYCKKSGRE